MSKDAFVASSPTDTFAELLILLKGKATADSKLTDRFLQRKLSDNAAVLEQELSPAIIDDIHTILTRGSTYEEFDLMQVCLSDLNGSSMDKARNYEKYIATHVIAAVAKLSDKAAEQAELLLRKLDGLLCQGIGEDIF